MLSLVLADAHSGPAPTSLVWLWRETPDWNGGAQTVVPRRARGVAENLTREGSPVGSDVRHEC